MAEHFHDMEAVYPYYRLIEEGAEVHFVGGGEESYTGKYGYPVDVDRNVQDVGAGDYDAVVIPGGWAPDMMRRVPAMIEFVAEMNRSGKLIAGICHAGWVLASAGAVEGRTVTSFFAIRDDLANAGARWVDEEVVVDGNLVTSRKPDDLPAFCRAIIAQLSR